MESQSLILGFFGSYFHCSLQICVKSGSGHGPDKVELGQPGSSKGHARISYRNGYEGLLRFLKLFCYCIYPKAILISFECL